MVDINFKELRAAIVNLNQSGLIKKKLSLVGVAKEKIYEDFMNVMDKMENDPETNEFPEGADEALAYFNKMADLEKKAEESKAKTIIKKEVASKSKKSEKKEKETKVKKESKGKGVILSIIDIIKEHGPIDRESIAKKLAKMFPERNETALAKTVYAQIGGSLPTRLEREKGIKIKKNKDNTYKI